MAANVNKWSETPASNATADPAINWAEGQAPSTVNDSARQMMAAIAADRDDTRGSLTFGGTSAALTLATNSGNVTYQNGLRVSGKLTSAFTAGATLNVDSVAAKNIYRITGSGAAAIQPSDGATGQHATFEYDASLNSSAGGWVFIGEAAGRLINVQVLTTSGTYTRTPGATTGILYGCGGGGGGGGAAVTAAGQFSVGSGGGSGSEGWRYTYTLPATASYVIGAGGGSTVSGGNTTFNSTDLVCNGGGHGVTGGAVTSGTTINGQNPGAGGAIGSGGTINFAGRGGGTGLITTNTVNGGNGGAATFSSGVVLGVGIGAGPAATGFGGGGGGAGNGASTGAQTGGAGSPGVIIVWEYA